MSQPHRIQIFTGNDKEYTDSDGFMTYRLANPIINARTITLLSFTMKNVIPNVSNVSGNNIFIHNGTSYTIPDGFYKAGELATVITNLVPDLTVTVDYQLGKFIFNDAVNPLIITTVGNVGFLLGIDEQLIGPAVTDTPGQFTLDMLSAINTIVIEFDSVPSGINSSENIMGHFTITNNNFSFANIDYEFYQGDSNTSWVYPEQLYIGNNFKFRFLDAFSNVLFINNNNFVMKLLFCNYYKNKLIPENVQRSFNKYE